MYVQELLRQAGLSVMTTDNVPDAVILLKALMPRAVVVGSGLRSMSSTSSDETFDRLLRGLAVIELPADFSTRDPTETGQQLLEWVRAAIK